MLSLFFSLIKYTDKHRDSTVKVTFSLFNFIYVTRPRLSTVDNNNNNNGKRNEINLTKNKQTEAAASQYTTTQHRAHVTEIYFAKI